LAAALLLAGCSAAAPAIPGRAATPVRVMSMNQCTDQLVLALLPPSRIASVTWLSRDPRYSAMVEAAGRVAINRGAVEEVAATGPDLIVTDDFSNPAGRALLGRLRFPVVTVPDAYDVAAIRSNLVSLAATLGVPQRGAALIARLDRQLAPSRSARRIRVAVWTRDGMSVSPLLSAVIAAAGLTDVTPATGPADVEALLRTNPDLLIETGGPDDGASLGNMRRDFPTVQHRWPASRILRVRAADIICGTPAIGNAAVSLRAQAQAAIGPRA
jgi:iron complex transport system substrate-binding protein